MNWDHVIISILAVFGALTLLLSQIHDVLVKFLEVITAWQQVRNALRLTGHGLPRPNRKGAGPVVASCAANPSATSTPPGPS